MKVREYKQTEEYNNAIEAIKNMESGERFWVYFIGRTDEYVGKALTILMEAKIKNLVCSVTIQTDFRGNLVKELVERV